MPPSDRLQPHLELASLPDDEFVSRAYRFLLRRAPDDAGRRRALRMLAEGSLSRATLLHELATSEEFVHVRALDDGVAFARWARAARERPRNLRAPPGGDSRLIEVPWVLARYRDEPRVLDVGYAYAEPAYLTALSALGARELVGVDLASVEVPGLRGAVADVRALPFAARSFDLVLAVSTLEHVGADTSRYGHADERDPEGVARALVELRRVLAGGGRLLATLPLGEPADLGWYVQHDVEGWERLFSRAGFRVFELEAYELADGGWSSSPPSEGRLLCAELRPRRFADRVRRRMRPLLTGP